MQVTAIKLKRNPFDSTKQRLAIRNSLKAAAEGARVDFMVTTKTWSFQPVFTVKLGWNYAEVSTRDQVYRWVTYGTPAHYIRPRRAKRLVFKGGSSPKTSPGVIRSRSGRSGSQLIFARSVRHPGTAPRLFHEVVKKKWEKQYAIIARKAVVDALKG